MSRSSRRTIVEPSVNRYTDACPAARWARPDRRPVVSRPGPAGGEVVGGVGPGAAAGPFAGDVTAGPVAVATGTAPGRASSTREWRKYGLNAHHAKATAGTSTMT